MAQEPSPSVNVYFAAARKRSLKLAVLFVLAALPALLSACGSDTEATNTPSGPISWPYVFKGTFTVAGEPGPVGTKIFTMLNGQQSGDYFETIHEGAYSNVLAGANKLEDIGKTITFHIGDPDGENVQADQTMVFQQVSGAQLLELDLTFPELP